MSTQTVMAAILSGLAFVAISQVPALAAQSASGTPTSRMSTAFLANVSANVDFLDRSSRLALKHTALDSVRSYARGETQEAAKVASALGAVPPAPSHDTVASLSDPDAVVTGRSVAVDTAADAKDVAANGRSPMGQAEFAHLTGLDGRAFDDLYWETQLDALSQLEADYRAYIARGDDPSLVALSQRELPKVMRRLVALTKI